MIHATTPTRSRQSPAVRRMRGSGVRTVLGFTERKRFRHLGNIKAGTGDSVQNLSYQYDNLGNLTSRQDANQNLTETFFYDSVNRLTSAQVNSSGAGILTTNYAYDAIGNITCKSDLATNCSGSSPNYTYPASGANSVKPHAVSRVNFTSGEYRSYHYDANGQVDSETQYTSANAVLANKGRTASYTSYNMLSHAANGSGTTLDFLYGPEHQRTREVSSSNGTTYYLNPGNSGDLLYEKDLKPDNSTEQRNYITAGGQVVALVKLVTTPGGSTWSTRYLHRDNLGSTTAVTDDAGTVSVIERLAYEPFGQRRFITGAHDQNNTITPQTTDRGYTNHEHLDELALINMNGRIYDPVTGRFMSPDPFIQDPGNLQSYNRYSYVWNNPYAGTDPSGFSWFGNAWHNAFHTYWNGSRDEYVKPVAAIVVAYFTGYYDYGTSWGIGVFGTTGSAGLANAMAAGFAGSYVGSGGDFDAAMQGMATAGMFYGVGSMFNAESSPFMNMVGHAAVGCASAEMGGGNCGNGALSAAAGAAWTNYGIKTDNMIGNLVATTIVGGTVSEIGGGKFANGAVTAAFGYLFNCVAHKCYQLGTDGTMITPKQGNGFYARPETLAAIGEIDARWSAAGERGSIEITDMSREIGPSGPPHHASHADGQDVDIRPQRIGGVGTGTVPVSPAVENSASRSRTAPATCISMLSAAVSGCRTSRCTRTSWQSFKFYDFGRISASPVDTGSPTWTRTRDLRINSPSLVLFFPKSFM